MKIPKRKFKKSVMEFFYTHLRADRLIVAVANFFTRFTKPDPQIVLFGAMNGKWYGDNSRHLFEWALQHRPDWKPIWLSRRTSVIQELRDLNLPVADMRTPKGMWLLFRAQRAVFTNSLRDLAFIPYLIPDRIRLVALRHGRSVKKIRFAREQHKLSKAEDQERRRESKLIAYVASTSDFVSDIQEMCLRLGRDKHRVTGYPRNDSLIMNAQSEDKPLLEEAFSEISFERVILYAPSWRHGREPTRFFPFSDFDAESLQTTLKDSRSLLLLRPHLRDLETYPEQATYLHALTTRYPRIALATHNAFPDVNTLLPEIDRLLTDYSALYHDFLLLDRPMGFIPYDFVEFSRLNGFLYDYFEYLPGSQISTASELTHWLETKESLKTCERRHKLRDKIHTQSRPDACEKVAALLDML